MAEPRRFLSRHPTTAPVFIFSTSPFSIYTTPYATLLKFISNLRCISTKGVPVGRIVHNVVKAYFRAPYKTQYSLLKRVSLWARFVNRAANLRCYATTSDIPNMLMTRGTWRFTTGFNKSKSIWGFDKTTRLLAAVFRQRGPFST